MQNHNQFHFFRKAAFLMQSRHASQLTFLPLKSNLFVPSPFVLPKKMESRLLLIKSWRTHIRQLEFTSFSSFFLSIFISLSLCWSFSCSLRMQLIWESHSFIFKRIKLSSDWAWSWLFFTEETWERGQKVKLHVT